MRRRHIAEVVRSNVEETLNGLLEAEAERFAERAAMNGRRSELIRGRGITRGSWRRRPGRSRFYGFGRLNAEQAVTLAKQAERNSVFINRTFNEPLPDLQTVMVSLDITQDDAIDDVAVHLDVEHTYVGDLIVTLVPQAGLSPRKLVLSNREGGGTQNIRRVFDSVSTPELGRFKGKNLGGTWMLSIQDAAVRDEGTLRSFGFELLFPSTLRVAIGGPSRNGSAPRHLRSKSLRRAGKRQSSGRQRAVR
jgi:subtilisin-like proprotein convertase family protein